MEQYIDLFCRISFRDKSYNGSYDVMDDLDTSKRIIENVENELFGLVMMTEPSKMLSTSIENNECDAIDVLQTRFDRCIESLEEYCLDKDKLEVLVDKWDDCHDNRGLAIAPPDEMGWDDCYMDNCCMCNGKNNS